MLSSNEIIATMQRGARNRMVASTKSNDESSRGHAIFLITVTKHDAVSQLTQKAQLYLVDLAGSEKADKTGTRCVCVCVCGKARLGRLTRQSIAQVLRACVWTRRRRSISRCWRSVMSSRR
jgi:kinesin family protein 5